MIHPTSKLKHIWDTLIILVTVVAAVDIPANIVIGYENVGLLKHIDIIYSLFFGMDLLLHFRSEVYVNNYLVKKPRQVALNYLRGWFFVDFIAMMPVSYMVGDLMLGMESGFIVYRLLRINHLFRIAHLISLYKKWQVLNILNPSVLRLVFFIFWISLIAHWAACGWVYLDGIPDPDLSNMDRYIRSLYWSVTTLTTVGYGDIVAKTIPQTVYNMLVMILGVGIYGYVIGNIASLLANIDVAKAHHQEKMERINAFLKYRNIPPELSHRITGYYNYLWQSRLGYDESMVISDLPPGLKTEVSLFLNRDIISKVPLFKGASEELIREIVLQLKPVVVTPGDYIFRKGEFGSEMYFINRGSVDVVAENGDTLATLSAGSFFGEIALLMSQTRSATIQAREFCDLYMLDKKSFDRILEKYPDFADQIQELARIRYGEAVTHSLPGSV